MVEQSQITYDQLKQFVRSKNQLHEALGRAKYRLQSVNSDVCDIPQAGAQIVDWVPHIGRCAVYEGKFFTSASYSPAGQADLCYHPKASSRRDWWHHDQAVGEPYHVFEGKAGLFKLPDTVHWCLQPVRLDILQVVHEQALWPWRRSNASTKVWEMDSAYKFESVCTNVG